MAVKTANIVNLQHQLDEAFPHRRKPDGWIGDLAHKGHTSGHNADDTPGSKPAWDGDPDKVAEVRDLDVATALGDGHTGQELVAHLVLLPDLEKVVRYLIHKGRIYHVRSGYLAEAFDGDPHTDHVHVEGAWSQAADNNSSFDFHLEDIAMPTADEIAAAVVSKLRKSADNLSESERARIAEAVWRCRFVDPSDGKTEKAASTYLAWTGQVSVNQANRVIAALGQTGAVGVDEGAIAAGVLAGLTPERLAAAITAAGLTPDALAAAIPADMAQQVIDALSDALAA